MNAAETSASRAMADCTPLAVVWRSLITAEIDTFMSDVSTTSTNIAMARSTIRRRLPPASAPTSEADPAVMGAPPRGRRAARVVLPAQSATWPSLQGGMTAWWTGGEHRLVRRGRDAARSGTQGALQCRLDVGHERPGERRREM